MQGDEDAHDYEHEVKELGRRRRYAVAVETIAVVAGLGAIGFAYSEGASQQPRLNGFWIDIGVSVGTALILVGILLRIQRAIAARLDATSAALTAVQRQFGAQPDAINDRMSDIAAQVAPDARRPHVEKPEAPATEPVSMLVGEWLARRLQRLYEMCLVAGHFVLGVSTQLSLNVRSAYRRKMARRVPRLLVLAGASLGAVAVVVLVFVGLGRGRMGHGVDMRASELPAETAAPENLAAAGHVEGEVRASCAAASNEPHVRGTVICRAADGNNLLVALVPGGPWASIYFADDEPHEVKAKKGDCQRQTPEDAVVVSKFEAAGQIGEVYCYQDEGEPSFKWFYGKGQYVASAQLNISGGDWASAYSEWLNDRELLLPTAVTRSTFEAAGHTPGG
jgi:hypothetical protein